MLSTIAGHKWLQFLSIPGNERKTDGRFSAPLKGVELRFLGAVNYVSLAPEPGGHLRHLSKFRTNSTDYTKRGCSYPDFLGILLPG